MARRPFFSGNYQLSSNANAANLIAQAGAAQGKMLQNLGSDIGGAIEKYGLNKEKRAKLTDKIENRIKLDPSIAQRLTKSGDEDYDKKNLTLMEKLSTGELGLRGLETLDSAMATIKEIDLQNEKKVTTKLTNKLLNDQLVTSKAKRGIEEELSKSKKQLKESKEKAYESIDAQIDQIEQDILDGMSYEDLPSYSKFLLANQNLIKNRQIPTEDLVYNPREELNDKTARLNFKILRGKKKLQDSNIEQISAETESVLQSTKDAKEEASILPDFIDRKQALASVQELPDGFSAKLTKFKDGFNVEYDYTKEAIAKIEPLDGFSRDTYLIGGNPYEKDPESKRLVKVVADRSDLNPQELNTIISTMRRRPDLDNYSKAKLRAGEPDEDGFYVFDVAGIEQKIPVNRQLEQDLLRLRRYENALENMIDFDASSL